MLKRGSSVVVMSSKGYKRSYDLSEAVESLVPPKYCTARIQYTSAQTVLNPNVRRRSSSGDRTQSTLGSEATLGEWRRCSSSNWRVTAPTSNTSKTAQWIHDERDPGALIYFKSRRENTSVAAARKSAMYTPLDTVDRTMYVRLTGSAWTTAALISSLARLGMTKYIARPSSGTMYELTVTSRFLRSSPKCPMMNTPNVSAAARNGLENVENKSPTAVITISSTPMRMNALIMRGSSAGASHAVLTD